MDGEAPRKFPAKLEGRYNGYRLAEKKPNYRKLIQYLLFAVAVLWIVIGIQTWSDQKAGVRPVKDRTRMADVAFPQLTGGEWRLSDHRGQVVLINYWASWCAPCRQETPGLIDLARDYRYKGLSIVGVAMDEGGKRAVESFLSEFHLPYPVLMPDLASPAAPAIDALPTTVLVDRNGRAAKSYIGAVKESVFRADVDRLLAEQPSSPTSSPSPSASRRELVSPAPQSD
jgi:cytochrome c biogenesis protein CcmG, thiol:disulfide interchange protein DsbE